MGMSIIVPVTMMDIVSLIEHAEIQIQTHGENGALGSELTKKIDNALSGAHPPLTIVFCCEEGAYEQMLMPANIFGKRPPISQIGPYLQRLGYNISYSNNGHSFQYELRT